MKMTEKEKALVKVLFQHIKTASRNEVMRNEHPYAKGYAIGVELIVFDSIKILLGTMADVHKTRRFYMYKFERD